MPHSPNTKPQVLVVGAGIVGASCAHHLAARGAEVTVLERAPHPAGGATAKSAAGIRHGFSHSENVRMSLHSARAFSSFEGLTGVNAGYRKVGYLFLVPEAGWADWQGQLEMQRSLGARAEALSIPELQARFPDLSTEGLGGASFGPDDGVVDPHAVTLGYLSAARRAGARVRLGTEVLELIQKKNVWVLHCNGETFHADAVVNAAGPFAGELGRRAGLNLPVLPTRRNVYVTAPLSDYPHPSPLMIDMGTGVWVRSEGERFIFGLSKLDEPPGDNQAVDWDWLEPTLTQALPRFPFLERAGLDARACWAGLYAITPDHLPILGEMPRAGGFFNACGFSGHGVQHSPATGLTIAEEILDGGAHSFDIQSFRFERFQKETVRLEQNVV